MVDVIGGKYSVLIVYITLQSGKRPLLPMSLSGKSGKL